MVCALRRRRESEPRFRDRISPVGVPHLTFPLGSVTWGSPPDSCPTRPEVSIEFCRGATPQLRSDIDAHLHTSSGIIRLFTGDTPASSSASALTPMTTNSPISKPFIYLLRFSVRFPQWRARYHTFLIQNQIHSSTTFVSSTWFSTFTRYCQIVLRSRSNAH